MKIKSTFNIQHSTPNIECRIQPAANSFGVRRSMFNVQCSPFQPSQRGVALIITIILLGVVTFMAIAFLALSRRERGAVTTVTDTASARLAADAALASAEWQIVANALANTNPFNFGLLVSTNFISGFGYNTAAGANPTNVNYTYPGGAPVTGNDFLQNLANLYYSPRPPVFIVTNQLTGSYDFRYYLDLNRNGRFDANGKLPVISPDPANPYYDNNGNTMPNIIPGNTLSNVMVGDPEWIGVLQRPDQPYGPNNPFVARYAFIAVPVGNTLDLNAIYNQAMTRSVNPASGGADGFLRNQGVGSWEINLAAFLTDLNINQWDTSTDPYRYLQPNNNNTGRGFEDALSLLSYRYHYSYGTLTPVGGTTPNGLFTTANSFPPFQNNIDEFGNGPLMTNLSGINASGQDVTRRWAGADNTNHFFTPSELFNSNDISAPFVNSLLVAGNTNSTYNRYTFYRLLAQLGTDSQPESGKMNLNYDNIDLYTNGVASSTNFMAWTPLAFFTNAADRLLRAYTAQWRNSNPTNFATTFYTATNFTFANRDNWTNYPAFGITNIPVLVSNQFVYSPAVNRLLQLAANIYDATTNNAFAFGVNYPSVFRPLFSLDAGGYGTNLFISGYTNITQVSGISDFQLATPIDVTAFASMIKPVTNLAVNVYGVPWIIGAKKGFPNFNKLGMQNIIHVTRKLQIKRSTIPTVVNTTTFLTNQLLAFSISNSIGVECWNSYSNTYPYSVQIHALDTISMRITNNAGEPDSYFYNLQFISNLTVVSWPGYTNTAPASSFTNPLAAMVILLTNSDFYFGSSPPGVTGFWPDSYGYGWESNKFDFPFPEFGLLTTNRLQLYMLDSSSGITHVIDYVHFAGPEAALDLSATIENNLQAQDFGANMWSTNVNSSDVPYGILSQIAVSDGGVNAKPSYWPLTSQTKQEIDGFNMFMTGNSQGPYGNASSSTNGTIKSYLTNYVVQVPYTPTITISEYTSWQANDPLVHYLASDLNFLGTENGGSGAKTGVQTWYDATGDIIHYAIFNQVNDRYQPWGVAAPTAYINSLAYNFTNQFNLIYKDPLVWSADYWDFPATKFPTVGWLGRVHRGTPWQTVYLKANNVLHIPPPPSSVGSNTWAAWTGDTNLIYGQYFDAANSAPLQDRLLFDLFTTAFSDNATRGTLSVNQSANSSDPAAGLAAWSALFSGMVALTNTSVMPPFSTPVIIPATNSWVVVQPAGLAGSNSVLWCLVTNINYARSNFVNADGVAGVFEHKGDILSTLALTEKSPFLNWNKPNQQMYGIGDEVYEWLPQQMMSLLRCSSSPRYVI